MNRSSHSRRGAATAVCLTIAFLASAAASVAQAPQTKPTTFKEIGVYLLQLDGKQVAARFFHSSGLARMLVQSPELKSIIELDPRTRSLALYSPADYASNPDGSRDRRSSARATGGGAFELVGKLPRFTVDGHKVQLLLKPPLLGETDREGIFAYDVGYSVRGEAYRTNADHMVRIRSYTDPIRVRVYFGSWCSVCYEVLPNILKLESELAGSAVEFEYYGLPQGAQDPDAQELGVTSVPTGIVYRNGQEIGRISGQSWRHADMSLANTLAGITKPTVGAKPPR